MTDSRPTLTISMGDPAGIGPEVTVKALADPEIRQLANWLVLGEAWLLTELAEPLGVEFDRTLTRLDDLPQLSGVSLLDCQVLERKQWQLGEVSEDCGRAGLEYVRRATEFCLAGRAEGIVTGPLSKEAVVLSGRQHFCGHTEYIAELCGVPQSRMMLVNDQLCVVHVSTHCSLREAANLDQGRIENTIRLGHQAMSQLGFEQPRIAVCGLNPHAGENGMFGDEEAAVIVPAINQVRQDGIECEGPFPADTLFMQAVRGKYDLLVAMYHDQGHVPMKLLDFEHTVNVTLGLPIIRTSVDHGTAFDIAGHNLADAEDMQTAMRLAVRLAHQRSLNQVVD